MAIYIKEFGKTREGRIVKKYTISNANGVSASFLDYGAIWKEMLLPEKEGITMSYSDTTAWRSTKRTGHRWERLSDEMLGE